MLTLSFQHRNSRIIQAPKAATLRLFSDVPRLMKMVPGLAACESTDTPDVYRMVYQPIGYRGLSFQANYTALYETHPSGIRWCSIEGDEGNVVICGKWMLEEFDRNTHTVSLEIDLSLQIPLPAMADKVVKSFLTKMVDRDLYAWMDRVQAAIGTLRPVPDLGPQ